MNELEYLTKRVEKLEKVVIALVLFHENEFSETGKYQLEELLKMLDMSQEDI